MQGNDVTHRPERDEIKQRHEVRLLSIGKRSPLAQLPIQSYQEQERNADGRKVALTGKIVLPARIDECHHVRKGFSDLMVVDDDNVEIEPPCGLEGLERRAAAIQGHQQLCLVLTQMLDRGPIRTVSFDNPVGNMNDRFLPQPMKVFGENGRRRRPVNVVVSKYRNLPACLQCIGDTDKLLRPYPAGWKGPASGS